MLTQNVNTKLLTSTTHITAHKWSNAWHEYSKILYQNMLHAVDFQEKVF